MVSPAGAEIEVCFVLEGRLVRLVAGVDQPAGPDEAVGALASPPAGAPGQVRTALADPLAIRSIVVSAGVATVDLSAAVTALGGDDQLLAVAQIVCTLTALPGVGQVSFAVEGVPVEVPRGDGSLVAQPVSRDDYTSLLP